MGKLSRSRPLTSLMQEIEDLPQQDAALVARLGMAVDYRADAALLVDDRPDGAVEPRGHGILGLVAVRPEQHLSLPLAQLGADAQRRLAEHERIGLLLGRDLGRLLVVE